MDQLRNRGYRNVPPYFFKNMKTIICDIDGIITNMWPIEKSVLLYMTDKKFDEEIERLKLSGISDTFKIFSKFSKRRIGRKKYTYFYNKSFLTLLEKDLLPKLEIYPLVNWALKNKNNYHFVYATGGQKLETEYVLENLGLIKCFDIINSVNKTTCRFSKRTGIPFRKIKSKFSDCIIIADSENDRRGAMAANIPFISVKPGAINMPRIDSSCQII